MSRFNSLKKTRANFKTENEFRRQGYSLIAGLDEVGRGSWAGPLVAGAVILPAKLNIGKIFDSKLLTKPERAQLNSFIKQKAICYGVGEATVDEINRLGLTAALALAYERALSRLDPQPELVLLDGLPFKGLKYRSEAIVKGDHKVKSIAAASVIAKEYRDTLMIKLSPQFPQYGFHRHKGYGTKEHQNAIRQYGVLEIHRKNYNWIKNISNEKRGPNKKNRGSKTQVAAALP